MNFRRDGLLIELLIKYVQKINPDTDVSLECEGAHIFAVWEISPRRYCKISVSSVNSWPKLKQNVDRNIQAINEKTNCPVCCQDAIRKVTCVQCSGIICDACYAHICRQGHGVYHCPFCRYAIGDVLEPEELEEMLNRIIEE